MFRIQGGNLALSYDATAAARSKRNGGNIWPNDQIWLGLVGLAISARLRAISWTSRQHIGTQNVWPKMPRQQKKLGRSAA